MVAVLLTGCDPEHTAQHLAIPYASSNAILSAQTESLTPDEMRAVSDTSTTSAYVLGPNDVISVSVYAHPELDVPVLGAASTLGGALITSDGTVELPVIGDMTLGGLTVKQAQGVLTAAYAKYAVNPNVALQLQSAQSLRYYLLGAFTAPGIKYPVREMTLLEALALGGSVDIASADLYQAYVAQGSVKLPVDLHALLIDGDLTQNISLASGDTIVIPSSVSENAFVFGAVGKAGPVEFESGSLSLLQALASAGMDLTSYTNARLARIHIIRAQGRSAEFMIVDARMIMEGQAASFALEPGDIVFVPPTEIATWNQVLNQLLPSLETVSAVLNPFVSLKYLRDK